MITKEEIKFLARELSDVDIALAATDIDEAWDYLVKLAKDDTDEYMKQYIAKNRSVAKAIKANAARYKVVRKHVIGDINDDYADIYEREIEALEDYCYQALGDLLEEKYPDAWAKLLVENENVIAQKKADRAKYEQEHIVKVTARRAEADQKRLEKARERYLAAVNKAKTSREAAAKAKAENPEK